MRTLPVSSLRPADLGPSSDGGGESDSRRSFAPASTKTYLPAFARASATCFGKV